MSIQFIHGDNMVELPKLADNSVDSIVSDAPYGMGKEPNIIEVMKDWIEKGYHEIKSNSGGFMGRQWDSFVPQPNTWKECYRVLKPGGYMLIACGTRTQDWMTTSIRFAGFEIRDVITWHYGSGFPKSMDISKAIDKKAGAERVITGIKPGHEEFVDRKNNNSISGFSDGNLSSEFKRPWMDDPEKVEKYHMATAPATDEAKQWEGWGTALKPATEFWTLCRKPLSENTVVENVLKHGTGGINIDASRVGESGARNNGRNVDSNIYGKFGKTERVDYNKGRFPSNVIFDEISAKILDQQSGHLKSGTVSPDGFKGEYKANVYGKYANNSINPDTVYGDEGGASRFFYVAKPSKKEKNKGCQHLEGGNNHETVKPLQLMRYLVKMITPKGGLCLDPFNGSGTTGIACELEGINYIGIDYELRHIQTSIARLQEEQHSLFNISKE